MAKNPKHVTGQLVDQVVDLKRTLGQFGRLIEISLSLNSTLEQDRILPSIIETASEVLDCEAVSILLYDEASGELRFAASTDLDPEELEKISVPLDNSIAGTIFLHNTPQLINNVKRDQRHFDEVGKKVDFESRSLIGVPMRIRENVIGVIEGINKHDGTFVMEDLDILSVIASQAAVAINNARMMSSLQQAYDDLAKLDKVKSDFIAIASHELRTPLTHILGYAQMLQDEATADGTAGAAQRVLKSATKLQTLVEDMTNMNMLETRTQELDLKPVAVQQMVVDIYKEMLTVFETKQIKVHFDLAKLPVMINADENKLGRAFYNAFNNAVNFTPEGGKVIVNVSHDAAHAHVSIKDSGPGIPAEELETIFDRFYQVESHMTRSFGGMGLGLPIARAMVELHGGRMWAESGGPGTGATILFTLPLAG
ncbi:MAG: GAF domain-containing sensor histidine kinase [Chloroflexota bacterium]